jgi:hypothetical protein
MWKQTLGNYFFQPCTNLLKIIKKKRTLQRSWQKKSHVDWIIIERVVIFWMWKENKKCEWKACKHDEHIWENATRQFVKCLRPDSNLGIIWTKRAPNETMRFIKRCGALLLVTWHTNMKSMQNKGQARSRRNLETKTETFITHSSCSSSSWTFGHRNLWNLYQSNQHSSYITNLALICPNSTHGKRIDPKKFQHPRFKST